MVVGGGTVKFHFEISFTGFTLLGTTFIRHKPTPVIRPPFKKAKDSRKYFLKLINLKKNLFYLVLWMEYNCFKTTDPLPSDSLLFTTKFQGVPGTHFIYLGRIQV